jgi:hypothetical protein
MDKDLLTKTLELAKSTRIPPKTLCADIGVTERWYYKLIRGDIKNPGVIHVQNLYKRLGGKK